MIQKLDEKLKDILDIDFEGCEAKNMLTNKEYFLKLKSCLINIGINEKIIDTRTEELQNIINCYITMENNLEKNNFYIESKVHSFIADLENKFIIAKDMTEKQFDEKIKIFINTLQNIFRLLQQKSINKTMCDLGKSRENYEKNIKEIFSIFNEFSSPINSKIDSVYKNLLAKIDTLINLGNSENTETYELKSKVEIFQNEYKNEIQALDEFIKEQLVSFNYKLDNKINSELINIGIVHAVDQISGSTLVGISLSAIHAAVILLIGGLLGLFVGSIQSLIKLIRGKNAMLKELEELRKEVEIQWNSTHFKTNKILNQSLSKAVENLKMIYETQISQINEQKVQELYEEFIHIIGDKYEIRRIYENDNLKEQTNDN